MLEPLLVITLCQLIVAFLKVSKEEWPMSGRMNMLMLMRVSLTWRKLNREEVLPVVCSLALQLWQRRPPPRVLLQRETDGRGRRGQGSVLALSSALAQAVWYNPEVQMGRVNIDSACLLVAGITSALRTDRPWVNASCLNLPGQEPSQLIDLNATL